MANEHKAMVEALESEIAELRRQFDLYFQGIERRPPVENWEDLKKRVPRMRIEAGRWRTAEKFRANTAYQKFLTLDRMWAREMKAIEDGTSRRDRFKVARMRAADEAAPAAAPAANGAPKSAPAGVESPARRAPPPAAGGEDEKMRRLYAVYMLAKKRTGEDLKLSFEGLKKQLEKQIPAIKQKHGCNNVDFKVVLKNGKAILKAVPK
jgi:hypothetical protein